MSSRGDRATATAARGDWGGIDGWTRWEGVEPAAATFCAGGGGGGETDGWKRGGGVEPVPTSSCAGDAGGVMSEITSTVSASTAPGNEPTPVARREGVMLTRPSWVAPHRAMLVRRWPAVTDPDATRQEPSRVASVKRARHPHTPLGKDIRDPLCQASYESRQRQPRRQSLQRAKGRELRSRVPPASWIEVHRS